MTLTLGMHTTSVSALQKETSFFGHAVSIAGFSTDPAKVSTVKVGTVSFLTCCRAVLPWPGIVFSHGWSRTSMPLKKPFKKNHFQRERKKCNTLYYGWENALDGTTKNGNMWQSFGSVSGERGRKRHSALNSDFMVW